MKNIVMAIVFDEKLENVALWLGRPGEWSGACGFILDDEDPALTCQRAFASLTGLTVSKGDWTHIVTLHAAEVRTEFWFGVLKQEDFEKIRAVQADRKTACKSDLCYRWPVVELPREMDGTLRWIIPCAADPGVFKPLGLAGMGSWPSKGS